MAVMGTTTLLCLFSLGLVARSPIPEMAYFTIQEVDDLL
jgi:hypothetical protein